LQNPRPPLFDPAVDDGLVALGGPADRTLHAPAQPVAQQRPHPGRVVADAGQPLDHQCDPLQGPQLPDEPIRRRSLEQGRDPELAGDLSLTDAGGEQLGCTQPTGLEPVAFSLCRRAARNGWHGPNPHPPSKPTPNSPMLLNPTPKAL
jgi:hypothetical protein